MVNGWIWTRALLFLPKVLTPRFSKLEVNNLVSFKVSVLATIRPLLLLKWTMNCTQLLFNGSTSFPPFKLIRFTSLENLTEQNMQFSLQRKLTAKMPIWNWQRLSWTRWFKFVYDVISIFVWLTLHSDLDNGIAQQWHCLLDSDF